MATYQDFHRIIKETIQVDADPAKRWTPQIVKFINHNNEFYGLFNGRINANEGLTASNCSLSNIDLSSCRIYDLSGNMIDLDKVVSDISAMNVRFNQISNEVWIYIPERIKKTNERIDNLSVYVDQVSSGISVLIDEKIKESKGEGARDLSAISSLLQSEIETEQETRETQDGILQTQINDISAKIKGGVVYRGVVSTSLIKGEATISNLLLTQEGSTKNDEVRNGFMYVNAGHLSVLEDEVTVGKGDYIYVNLRKEGLDSVLIKEMKAEYVDILDAMDSRVYDLIREISGDVEGLKSISSDHETRILNTEGQISQISGDLSNTIDRVATLELSAQGLQQDVNSLCTYIDSLDSQIGVDGEVLVSVLQENGKIVECVHSKITNNFITDESISQSKITDLVSDLFNISSELSTVSKRNRNDLSYFGTVIPSTSDTLSTFLWETCHDKTSKFIKGFTFRLDSDALRQPFKKNDYLIFNKTLEDFRVVQLSDIDIIHDFSHEVQDISNYISSLDGNIILDSDSGLSVLTSVEQKDGKISFASRKLVSSDVEGLSDWVKAKIDELDVTDKVIPSGHIISSLTETNGKIDYGTRQILSSDVQDLDKYVENEIGLSVSALKYDNIIEKGKLISHLSQKDGTISVETTDILSDYVVGLSDYVKEQIRLSTESLDSEISSEGKVAVKVAITDGKLDTSRSMFEKIKDEYIDVISQSKISNLTQDLFNISSDLSSLIIRDRGDVSLMGDFKWTSQDVESITLFLRLGTEKDRGYILRKGFLYRLPSDQKLSSLEEGIQILRTWHENDFVLVKNDVVLSDANFGSFNYIKDFDSDIRMLCGSIDSLDNRCVHLSGNNVISGYNEFVDLTKMSQISVSFQNVFDDSVDKYLSVQLKDLNNPMVLDIAVRINDIIKYAKLDIERIQDFNSTVVSTIRERTIRIFESAYPTEPVPPIRTFGDIVTILNGVLGVLKMDGPPLETRLQALQQSIDTTVQYIDVVNTDLSSLCVHVNLSCAELKENICAVERNIGDISSSVGELSTTYSEFIRDTFVPPTEGSHISSYGLIITDEKHKHGGHDRYEMTFLSGTLVLRKI